MRRRRRPIAALTILSLTAVCLLASTTDAAALACGDVITEDTTLEHDLLDCPGDGLIIGADNVTLRLNGFMIDSLHPAPDVFSELRSSMAKRTVSMEEMIDSVRSLQGFSRSGITIDEGKKRVNILGPGIVRDFTVGVSVENKRKEYVYLI